MQCPHGEQCLECHFGEEARKRLSDLLDRLYPRERMNNVLKFELRRKRKSDA